jgi:hypothetical protein
VLPTSPKPNDGVCNDYYNTYWYHPMGQSSVQNGKTVYSSYELWFCLGDDTGGYKSGINKLTPAGIKDVVCEQNCEGTNGKQDAMISATKFDAEFRFEVTYYNFGQIKNVQTPANAFDIFKQFTDSLEQSKEINRDSKRLADVRQLAATFELYFNDKSAYPQKLNNLTPRYLGVIPTAPTPNDGQCTKADNDYTYKFISKDKYELSFCLGQVTAGYTAGKHLMTPAGIY